MADQDMQDALLSGRLGRMSDRICSLILFSDLDWIDIEIEIERMREVVEERIPGRLDLFERVYYGRFLRLREQWRGEQGPDGDSGDGLFN